MTDGKKIILFSVIAFLVFGTGFAGGYIIRQAVDSKRIREYRNTVNYLGNQLDELREVNTELAESNQSLKNRLGELTDSLGLAQSRVEKARGLIEEIRKGLSGSTNNIREIIKAVRGVIEKIEQLGESE